MAKNSLPEATSDAASTSKLPSPTSRAESSHPKSTKSEAASIPTTSTALASTAAPGLGTVSAAEHSRALRASLEQHNATFEALLRLIPAKFYIVDEPDPVEANAKYQKHRKHAKEAKEHKKERERALKRLRLDPMNHKTVVDIHETVAAQAQAKVGDNADMAGDNDVEAADSGEDDKVDVDAAVLDGPSTTVADSMSMDASGDSAPLVPMPAATGGIAELRAKLHARMDALRKRRGAPLTGEGGTMLTGKDALIEERRRAMREKRRKETKERRRQEKGAKTAKTQLLVSASPPPGNAAVASSSKSKGEVSVAFNTTIGAVSSKSKRKNAVSANQPAVLLQQLQAQKSRLLALPEDARRNAEERRRWARAAARMEGAKNPGIATVSDDADGEERKLKKAIKRKEKEKERSKKAWDERKKQVADAMKARQAKRADNIAVRNERRKGGKHGKGAVGAKKVNNAGSAGKGKQRAGFEGKSTKIRSSKRK
ncbi:hypothetical protein FISHEDRAFT_71276 [Fistulina hepatica ATCC 64428]|nr:hypothetical protein FISHEDRAFT_71276 [Fistulina hepatica ATCC 64428]